MMIMQALALGVEVPSTQIAETIDTVVEPADDSAQSKSHMRIRSAEKRPEDAFAAIRYRSHWFWIGNSDVQSKRALSFIQLLMNLSEGGTGNKAPVLTLPTG